MKNNESVFETLIQGRGSWRDHPCGTGSTMQNTVCVRDALPDLLERYSINSMLDVPCGDHSWMSHVAFPDNFTYTGADIVGSMIESNRLQYPQHNWLHLDAVAEPLPTADLVFARDFFIHISDECIFKFLRNVVASGSKYLLASNYLHLSGNTTRTNIDGSMRQYDLRQPPYDLPQPLEVIAESYDRKNRCMALWRVTDIENSLK